MFVYDFDRTVYDGDSTIDFYLFCMKEHRQLLVTLPANLFRLVLFTFRVITREQFKQSYFQSFLPKLDNINSDLTKFWEVNKKKIKSWYLEQRQSTDVIISASPEFILEPICSLLQIDLVATKVNPENGLLDGLNCRGKEKINRFYDKFGSSEIDAFYSDHKSDAPLAILAKSAFLVRGETVVKWRHLT
jgi:phosphoserine phosphatase